MRTHQRIIIAHHLILTLYGHWLSNDPRGSGSTEIRKEELEELGPILPGRQYPQPPKWRIKRFYQHANALLAHRPFWFDPAKRQAIAEAFREVVARCNYTCWSCAILWNHAHLVIRRHRDDAQTMWDEFAHASKMVLQTFPEIESDHPVWSDRPYKVFCYDPDGVRGRITYVENNPGKEGLEPQRYDFVKLYDGWPHRKK